MAYIDLLLVIALVLGLSKAIGVILEKLGIPQVIGMILAGLVVGALWFVPTQSVLTPFTMDGLGFFAKIGVVLLMFSAGIGTDLTRLKQTGVAAVVITLFGVAVPLGLGYVIAGAFFGFDQVYSCLFYGVILTATSVSVTVAALKELGKLDSPIGTAIISAAILDDIIGVVLLSLISGLAGAEGEGSAMVTQAFASAFGVSPHATWLVALVMLLFFGVVAAFGIPLRRWFAALCRRSPHCRRLPVAAFALAFLLAWVAEQCFGVADITGAFLAGLLLSGLSQSEYIGKKADICTYMMFGPLFFANIGLTTMQQAALGNFVISPYFWGFGVCFVLVGLASKFVGCGVGAKICKFSTKDSIRAGVGMMVRAEVILICAQRGLKTGLIDSAIMPFVLAIVLFGSIITPLVLKLTYHVHELPRHPVDSVHNF